MQLPGAGGRPKVPGRSAYGKVLACKDPVGPLDCNASLTEGRPRSVNGPKPVAMALTKSLTRLDHPTLQTHGEGGERETLLALSQRKLNALGMPVCYIDANQRYRFVNRAFLEWTGKTAGEVSGREIVEVDGRVAELRRHGGRERLREPQQLARIDTGRGADEVGVAPPLTGREARLHGLYVDDVLAGGVGASAAPGCDAGAADGGQAGLGAGPVVLDTRAEAGQRQRNDQRVNGKRREG